MPDKGIGDTADRIIYAALVFIFLMGLLSFFVDPRYEKGAWAVMGMAGSALSGALGFKFGVSTPKKEDKPENPHA